MGHVFEDLAIGWAFSEQRAFDIPAGARAPYLVYRINVAANNGNAYLSIEELELFLATTGGPNMARSIGAVLRTLTSTTPSVAYTAALQTTDFGAPAGAVPVSIAQLSGLVGRGIPAEAIL